jgi:hypothetical protein
MAKIRLSTFSAELPNPRPDSALTPRLPANALTIAA